MAIVLLVLLHAVPGRYVADVHLGFVVDAILLCPVAVIAPALLSRSLFC